MNRRIYYFIYTAVIIAITIAVIWGLLFYLSQPPLSELHPAVQLLLKVVGVLLLSALVAVGARLTKSTLGFSIRGQSGKPAFFTLLFVACNLPFTLGMILIPLSPQLRTLRILWRRLSRPQRIVCFCALVVSTVLTALILTLAPATLPGYWLIGLTFPLLTEMLFRGFFWDKAKGKFQRGVVVGRFYLPGLVLVTALLYVVWSIPFWIVIEGADWRGLALQILFAFVGGLFYGFARERTASLHAPLLLHQLVRIHPFGWLASLALAVYLFFIPEKGETPYNRGRIIHYR